jgi:glycerol uptake facilitator-like aquaporin
MIREQAQNKPYNVKLWNCVGKIHVVEALGYILAQSIGAVVAGEVGIAMIVNKGIDYPKVRSTHWQG